MSRTNHYIYKWKKEMTGKLREVLQPGDRVTVSIRDFGEEENREVFAALRAEGMKLYVCLPVLWRPGQGPSPEEAAGEADGFYASNIGQIPRLLETGKPVMGDVGLNVFNRETAEYLNEIGLSGVTWSFELENESLPFSLCRPGSACDLPEGQSRTPVHCDWRAKGEDRADVPLRESPERERPRGKYTGDPMRQALYDDYFQHEVLRSGRVPAMVSEYCPLAGAEGIWGSGCGRCKVENPVWLKDFKGERYPVLLEPEGCTALILSRKPLDRPEADAFAKEYPDIIKRICLFD